MSTHYNLERFLQAQDTDYPIAFNEISEGQKRSHWIWYIFPQQKGLGRSYYSQYYALDGISEAQEYLRHPILGERLRAICQELLKHKNDKSILQIMGSHIDVVKLKSSMQLFDQVSPDDVFNDVLIAYYKRDR